ncbi:hypothetical protein [Nocardioides mesophilus]|uniref:Uncharacterized protein n=1 Tax=Nocardioides mesophilus TaxID=433659 RepID=A0A7G9RC11_9ACTN|nr:hypothetical protein [Nocardioides mesophilus]QNN53136.1 hypothetical protein H9L09_01140 [Nocardioides mesophilus]
MDLQQAADELFALTPTEFTPARNELAKQLKAEDRELSERVKALRKPAAAAWVVNMLVRHDAAEMTQVLDLGESLRQAQADLDGDALRELNKQRRRLIAAVAGKGRGVALELGQKVSESVMRQVEEILHAAMIDTDAAAAVRTGLLVEPLSATGVGTIKAATAVADHTALGGRGPTLAPAAKRSGGGAGRGGGAGKAAGAGTGSGGTGRLRSVPEPDPEERRREERRRAREAALRAVREAEETLAEAQEELASRERKVSDLQARTLQVNGELDELRRRIDELEDRLERLDAKAEDAAEAREEAAGGVAAAEAELADARARVEELGGD